MREILFRGKRIDNGEWVKGGSIARMGNSPAAFDYYIGSGNAGVHSFDVHGNILSSETLGECLFYKVGFSTIGQYTGMTDKIGNQIYEGDIVEKDGKRMYVVFHKGSWMLWDHEENDDFLSNWCSPCYWFGKDIGGCAIVGNIYDSPELMEE